MLHVQKWPSDDELVSSKHVQENLIGIYRVIHKSLRDFRPLRYSRRDGHAEGEHVNRGRDTPSFCLASAIPGWRDLLNSEGS